MGHNGFLGLRCSAYYHKAIAPKKSGEGWRVRTFTTPSSVALFVAHSLGRTQVSLVYETGEVELIDANGALSASKLGLLSRLLSEDEYVLLKLYGIEPAKLPNATE